MASIKKKSSGGGGANWMDTYGDMVTLLLCFFVLLYSISTIDQTKWMLVVQSFNRNAVINENETPPGPEGSDTNQGGDAMPFTTDVEQALTELYEFLQANVASDDISVSKGDGYVFVSFAEAVFFAPNSSVLRQEGKDVLDIMLPPLRMCAPSIDELQVMGNTAQARNDDPNNPVFDRQLASLRATEVVIYLQQNIDYDLLNPGRLVPIGYGQWRNMVSNETMEGKARNRRVEMIITGRDLEDTLSDSYQKYYTMLHSTGSVNVPD